MCVKRKRVGRVVVFCNARGRKEQLEVVTGIKTRYCVGLTRNGGLRD